MEEELSLREMKKEWHGSYKAYAIGFFASLILTSLSFLLVVNEMFTPRILIYSLTGLALSQAVVQLIFFLHLGQEAKPRWETVVFFFMFSILIIIAGGTLWIMHDLDERTMSPSMMTMPHD
jgi:cytochrome o ubiquinol oxidase subunit IV